MHKTLAGFILLAATGALQAGEKAPDSSTRPAENPQPAGCAAKQLPGCAMMSADELKAHREKIASFKDHASCMSYLNDHHRHMMMRAKERNVAPLPADAGESCEWLNKPAPVK